MKRILKLLIDKLKLMKSGNLRRKLLISYICITFISVSLVSILTYRNTEMILTNKIIKFSENINSQTKLNINQYLTGIENSVAIAFSDTNIMNFNPYSANLIDSDYLQNKERVESYLKSLSMLNKCTDFALVYDDGSIIGQTSDITLKLFNKDTIYSDFDSRLEESEKKSVWLTGIKDNFNKIFYIKRLKENTILMVSVNNSGLDEIFGKLQNINNTIYSLVDSQNKIIYSSDNGYTGTSMKINDESEAEGQIEDKNNLVLYTTCNNDWKLVSYISNKYVLEDITKTAIYTLIIGIFCILSALVIGSIISKKISMPINILARKIEEVSKGNLTVKTDIHTNDEIEQLSNSFNMMVDKIRVLLENATNVVNIVAKESKGMNEMSCESQQISNEIAVAMGEIANGSSNQLEELGFTTETMNNLAISINNMKLSVKEVSDISNETSNVGNKSIKTIDELQIKNNNSNRILDDITTNIEALIASIIQIENVVTIIDEFNEQTNLLSLNASIEAARAGEHGAGFSVVADEVRKLAYQSKSSTDNIHNIIKNIYVKVNSINSLINNSKVVFKEQTDSVKSTYGSFTNIIEYNKKITNAIKLIDSIMREIDIQKEKTLNYTNSVKAILENSSANIEEVFASAEEQSNKAESMKDHSSNLNNSIIGLETSLKVFQLNTD